MKGVVVAGVKGLALQAAFVPKSGHSEVELQSSQHPVRELH